MAPKLYKSDLSPPARSVYLTAEALGITLDYVQINFEKHEQLQPEFIKINPQHTVPTLEDEGKIIWDSHAINVYLVTKYGKNDALYPKDPYKRAMINQRLHFDSGVLFTLIRAIVRPMVLHGVKTVSGNLINEVNQGYGFLEKFLEGHNWAVGDNITLADFSLVPSITSLDVLVPLSSEKYSNIVSWIERARQLPYYHVNQKGLEDFRAWIQKLMS